MPTDEQATYYHRKGAADAREHEDDVFGVVEHGFQHSTICEERQWTRLLSVVVSVASRRHLPNFSTMWRTINLEASAFTQHVLCTPRSQHPDSAQTAEGLGWVVPRLV